MSVHWYRLEYQDFLGYQSIHYNPITVGMSSTLNCIWIVRYIYMVITIYLITGPASSTCGWTNIITMENIYFFGGGRRGDWRRDLGVDWFTSTNAICADHQWNVSSISAQREVNPIYNKIKFEWLAVDLWFSPGLPSFLHQ
jgi:hypothetical protein